VLKRQERSAKITSEHIQKKLVENGIHKDDLCKNLSVSTPVDVRCKDWFHFSYYARVSERLSRRLSLASEVKKKVFFKHLNERFLPGKAIKKRTPSASQLPTITTATTDDSSVRNVGRLDVRRRFSFFRQNKNHLMSQRFWMTINH
jgi:hypothetical protein